MLSTNPPSAGGRIRLENGALDVPDTPTIPFIEGDGIGADIWRASRLVFDAAIEKAYAGSRRINWLEVYAGGKAHTLLNTWLPEQTLEAFSTYLVGIKGPLATPVGGGIRSLNVAIRKALDLYVCQRPVRWLRGVPSPMRHPERVNMVVFRENTEDLYAGIEFEAGSPENLRFTELLRENFPQQFEKIRFPASSGMGIKPVSRDGSQRLVRAAIRWALENQRQNVALVHKGNIMKFTEGAFRNWGYELAEQEFGGRVYTRAQWDRVNVSLGQAAADQQQQDAIRQGRLLVRDLIADSAFEQTLTRPEEFDVLATTNLNGDYLSDALSAQVGGVGIAPGANINYDNGVAVFEATHGTAPPFANQNKANPCSLILSGEMMLQYIGWHEAADLIVHGIEGAISSGSVTFDFYRLMDKATLVGTAQFADAVIEHME